MKVFLSWSGARSKAVALALRQWLPLALHYVRPWLSERDIIAGERWSVEIARELEDASFGIIVVTAANLNAPWLLFEAGALSKAFTSAFVVPYLVDVEYSDLAGPLSQFQGKRADRSATLDLLRSVNHRALEPITDENLSELFDLLWPKLETTLNTLPVEETPKRAVRPERDVLEELVASIRRLESRAEARFSGAVSANMLGDIPIPLSILVTTDIPGLEKNSVVRVVTSSDAIADVACMLALDIETYGIEWCLTGTRSKRAISREAGSILSQQARHGEVTLALRRIAENTA